VRRIAIAIATSIDSVSAAAPATTRTRRISSVAYADDEIASELKIGRASFLGSRSSASSSFERGRPNRDRRAFAHTSASPVRGAVAASFAVSIPAPV
jgi:hypothetical protein